MPNEPVTEALTAYTALLAGETFPNPSVDITSGDFALPALSGILATLPSAITLADLTDKTVDGTGAFDVLMSSIKAHLQEEYDTGRITGREYAETYIALVTAAMTTGSQFLIQKDSAAYQNALVLMQARTAQIQATIAAAELARARQNIALTELQVLSTKVEYALNKLRLATEDITYTKIEQDVALGAAQVLNVQAETAISTYRHSDIMPEEKRQITYQTDYVLATQVAKGQYEVASILPKQATILDKDGTIKQYQIDTLLVDQHNLLLEQIQVQRAQTLDTRVDGVTAIAGAIGKQKELYSEQISSYIKDARYKGAKLWSDSWLAQKSLDEGLLAPDEFSNANVNEVLSSLKTNLGLEP